MSCQFVNVVLPMVLVAIPLPYMLPLKNFKLCAEVAVLKSLQKVQIEGGLTVCGLKTT